MKSPDIIIESYDDDVKKIQVFEYWISKKGYFYYRHAYENEEYSKPRRISERAYTSALEEFHGA